MTWFDIAKRKRVYTLSVYDKEQIQRVMSDGEWVTVAELLTDSTLRHIPSISIAGWMRRKERMYESSPGIRKKWRLRERFWIT